MLPPIPKRSLSKRGWFLSPVLLAAAFALAILPRASAIIATTSLADMSLEELINVRVVSVSKKETSVFRSPAAVSVLSNDDLRRLGSPNFAEALRWVPGLNVGQISTHTWSIGSRGFDYQYADKLLVLMDGRSVYTPTFGGVFWDMQDAIMADVDRVEVIRGPGATLWGANAVNGVINIISKSSEDTQGWLVSSEFGTADETPSFSARYGGRLGSNLSFRVYGKYFDRDAILDQTGEELPDKWRAWRGGFRVDWNPTPDDAVMFQGDVTSSDITQRIGTATFTPPYIDVRVAESQSREAYVLGKWTRTFSASSNLMVQAYFDHNVDWDYGAIENRDTADLELQHRFSVGSAHDLMYGVGYRRVSDDLPPVEGGAEWYPQKTTRQLWTGFIQDEVQVVPDLAQFVMGTKVEHNQITGFEIQPNIRLLLTPTERSTYWASFSRATRTPARVNTGLKLPIWIYEAYPGGPLVRQGSINGSDPRSEEVMACEAGWRMEPSEHWTFDLSTFYNRYHRLYQYVEGTTSFSPTPVPHVDYFAVGENSLGAASYGAELAVQWRAAEFWRVSTDASAFRLDTPPVEYGFASDTRFKLGLRSYTDLSRDLELLVAASYVSGAKVVFWGYPSVPAYTRLDLGLTWRPRNGLELSVWGRNLLQSQHLEYYAITAPDIAEVPRSFVGRLSIRF